MFRCHRQAHSSLRTKLSDNLFVLGTTDHTYDWDEEFKDQHYISEVVTERGSYKLRKIQKLRAHLSPNHSESGDVHLDFTQFRFWHDSTPRMEAVNKGRKECIKQFGFAPHILQELLVRMEQLHHWACQSKF
jgi:hypothetical protein